MHNSVPILTFKCYNDPAEVHFLLICSPHQSPALEALSPLSHSCCRQHKPVLSHWHEFATPPHHSRHCPGPPDCGWTHLPHTYMSKFLSALYLLLAKAKLHELGQPHTCTHIPQFDCAIIRGCDHKTIVELQTSDCWLVFVRTWWDKSHT